MKTMNGYTVPMKQWRRVRVVVEVPVLGDYTEKDLSWDVQRLIDGGQLNRRNRGKIKTGRVLVKEAGRVIDSLYHKTQEEKRTRVQAELDRLTARVQELSDPHPD